MLCWNQFVFHVLPPFLMNNARSIWLWVCWFEKNEELCSLSLVDIVISDQCANGLPQFEMQTCHFSSSNFLNTKKLDIHIFGCFKTKNIVCILVVSVVSNIFKCQKSWYSHPYFSAMTFQDTEDFNMYTIFCLLSHFKFLQMSEIPILPPWLACVFHINFTYSFPKLKII